MSNVDLRHGDCLAVMRELPDNSVDAVVTDPPYSLSFMGRAWDTHETPFGFQQWCEQWASECLRVLKPGGHMLAFGGTRTWHRLACAVEDAGFEVRDNIAWLYGSGFPKSLSVHKATLNLVGSRYAESRCDCLDSGDGRPAGNNAGCESRSPSRAQRVTGPVPASAEGDTDVPVNAGTPGTSVRELRGANDAPAEGHSPIAEAVLLAPVLIGRAEAQGLGHAEVRPGLEEHAGQGQAARSGLPIVRDASRGDRAAHSPSEAVQVRRDEPAPEPGEPVRFVPPHDRSGDDGDAGSDSDRREPRRVHADDQGGRRAAVARVCSWCGLPDRGWLRSLEGLGTAAKPAFEPVVVARKPLVGTVAQNVQQFGTGALNVDATRINPGAPVGGGGGFRGGAGTRHEGWDRPSHADGYATEAHTAGRWPANVALSSDQAAALDQMSGITSSVGKPRPRSGNRGATQGATQGGTSGGYNLAGGEMTDYGDSGGASRYFLTAEPDAPDLPIDELAERFMYCAKAPKSERPTYVKEGASTRVAGTPGKTGRQCNVCGNRTVPSGGTPWPACGHNDWSAFATENTTPNQVAHPTVKPLALMRWLVRLVTPPGGTVLEPFAGSGTTVEAAILEGFDIIAIEREADYLPLIQARIFRAQAKVLADAEQDDESHPSLFDDEGAA